MKKLSKREKTMIYVMVLFLIVGGGFLLIRQTNLIGKFNQAQNTYEDMQMQLEISTLDASQKAGIDSKLEEEQKKVEELSSDCKKVQSDDYVEQDLLKLAKQYKLSASSTSFEEQKEVTSASGQSLSLDENGVQLTENKQEQKTNTSVKKRTIVVSVELKGGLKNYFDFLDAVDEEKCMMVRSSKIYDPNDRVSYQMGNGSSYTYYLQIQYDMLSIS